MDQANSQARHAVRRAQRRHMSMAASLLLLALPVAGCGEVATATHTATAVTATTTTPGPTGTPGGATTTTPGPGAPPLPGGGLAVANGIVYTGARDGYLYAFDAATGARLWRFQGGAEAEPPAVANGVVYFGGRLAPPSGGLPPHTYLYALDAATGKLRWRFGTGIGLYLAPVVSNGVVYAGAAESALYALRASDGTQLWTIPAGGCAMGEVAVDSTTLYVNLQACGFLVASRLSDGQALWQSKLSFWGAPIPLNGTVYIGYCALRASDGNPRWCDASAGFYASQRVVLGGVDVVTAPAAIYGLDASTGNPLWQRSDLTHPVALGAGNGVVYLGADDGYVYALQASDGRQLWRTLAHPRIAESLTPEPVGSTLYIEATDGSIEAIRAADGALLWHAPLGQ